MSLRRKTGLLFCHSSIMTSPMRYRATFKGCNMLHLRRFLVCCLWFSTSWKLSLWWIIFNILLYLMVQWTCLPHIYRMIFFKFYILGFSLVLSSHWWLVNLFVRHASDLVQPLNQWILHSCNCFGQIYFRVENWCFDWYISYFFSQNTSNWIDIRADGIISDTNGYVLVCLHSPNMLI